MRKPLPPILQAASSPYEALCTDMTDDLADLDHLLGERLTSTDEPLIGQVAQHLVNAGGKRIRPLLTLATARASGYEGRDHLSPRCGPWSFCTAPTLLHDDVVDASPLRRGETTAHMIWGNKTSILVGDFLFSRSFALMVECGSLPILEALASAAATIAEGEVMQLSTARDLDLGDERYLQVPAREDRGRCLARRPASEPRLPAARPISCRPSANTASRWAPPSSSPMTRSTMTERNCIPERV